MDRNWWLRCWQLAARDVALRKESVDRNYIIKVTGNTPAASLSARRAWIEIRCSCRSRWVLVVALRKESVDRNSIGPANMRAYTTVALRKESVDRNTDMSDAWHRFTSRSPQGERG